MAPSLFFKACRAASSSPLIIFFHIGSLSLSPPSYKDTCDCTEYSRFPGIRIWEQLLTQPISMIIVRLDNGHTCTDGTTYFQVSMEHLQKWHKYDFTPKTKITCCHNLLKFKISTKRLERITQLLEYYKYNKTNPK